MTVVDSDVEAHRHDVDAAAALDVEVVIELARRRARRRRRIWAGAIVVVVGAVGVVSAVIIVDKPGHPHPRSASAASRPSAIPGPSPCSTDPSLVVDLTSLRAWSSQAKGTPAPVIANYGGHYATADSRNFVAQVSGAQASAAHLVGRTNVLPADRIVLVAVYGPMPFPQAEGAPLGVTNPTTIAAGVGYQDLTSGRPAMSVSIIDAHCYK